MSAEQHAPNPHAARLRTASRFEHDEGYAESLRLAADLIDAAVDLHQHQQRPIGSPCLPFATWEHGRLQRTMRLCVAIEALTTPRPGAEDA